MSFAGNTSLGPCKAGGTHDHTGSGDYVLGQLMNVLEFDTGPLTFSSGIALGGASHLTLGPDGSYTFSGTWHDSGALGYDESFAWAIADANNQVYTFARSGSTAGTFESGSRDDPWNITGTNPAISSNWAALCASGAGVWQDAESSDLQSLVNNLLSGIQAVAGVVSAVFAIVGPVAAAAA